MHAAFVRDGPEQSLLAQGRKAAELLCAWVSEGFQARHCEQARELTPDKVYGAGMTAGRLLIAIITTAL